MEIKSKYYQEAGANKSNALTSVGITIGIIFLSIFGLFRLINLVNGDTFTTEVALHERYCGKMLHNLGYSYSTIKYEGTFSDKPKYPGSSGVYSFEVTNFKEPSGKRRTLVGIKCEYNLSDNLNKGHVLSIWDKN